MYMIEIQMKRSNCRIPGHLKNEVYNNSRYSYSMRCTEALSSELYATTTTTNMKQNKIISFTSELNTVGFIDNNQTQGFANFIWADVRNVS